MKIIRGYLGLPKQKKNLILKSVFLTFLIRLSLYFFNFSKIDRYAKKIHKSNKKNSIEDVLWSVKTASNIVPGTTCLTTAMTGHILLSIYNYSSYIRLGVKNEDKFEAHAWLEINNKIVLGELDTEYVPLVKFK
jgi:hypothetical protein